MMDFPARKSEKRDAFFADQKQPPAAGEKLLLTQHSTSSVEKNAAKIGSSSGYLVVPPIMMRQSSTMSKRSVLPQDDMGEDFERPEWPSQLEFIMTCISCAVGLGNVWRFPALCFRNGGGAFLLPYLIMLVLIGIPIFFLEVAFGQFASLGPLTIWTINPFFKGLGYGMVLVTSVIFLYYNVIIAQCVYFLGASFCGWDQRIWNTCGNSWNTADCYIATNATTQSPCALAKEHLRIAREIYKGNVTHFSNTTFFTTLDRMRGQNPWANYLNSTFGIDDNLVVDKSMNCTHAQTLAFKLRNDTFDSKRRDVMPSIGTGVPSFVGSSTEEFLYNQVLGSSPEGISDMGYPQWILLGCLAVSWIVVAAGLLKGIKSLGKIAYFTALFPYFMLTVLLVRGATLEGAVDGIIFYLVPKWELLLQPIVWQRAACQIFYNLSAATGGLIAMASFNRFNNNCLRDAIIIPALNAFTSVFAGFVVFAVIGHLAFVNDIPVEDVKLDGPGLVFIAYPEALARIPFGAIFSVLFFVMMLTLGFGSELALVETVLTAFQDDLRKHLNTDLKKKLFRLITCLVCFLITIPMVCRGGIYLLDLVDNFISSFALLFICFFEVMVLAWIYGYPQFAFMDDIEMMLQGRPKILIFFKIMWRYVTPITLIGLFFSSMITFKMPEMSVGGFDAVYPQWAVALGWIIAVSPIILVPAWMVYLLIYVGVLDMLKEQNTPMINWGPRNQQDRTGRYSEQTLQLQMLKDLQAQSTAMDDTDYSVTKA